MVVTEKSAPKGAKNEGNNMIVHTSYINYYTPNQQATIQFTSKPTPKQTQRQGGRICVLCGRLYSRRHKKNKHNGNINRCGHCNRSIAAKQLIQKRRAAKHD